MQKAHAGPWSSEVPAAMTVARGNWNLKLNSMKVAIIVITFTTTNTVWLVAVASV